MRMIECSHHFLISSTVVVSWDDSKTCFGQPQCGAERVAYGRPPGRRFQLHGLTDVDARRLGVESLVGFNGIFLILQVEQHADCPHQPLSGLVVTEYAAVEKSSSGSRHR